MSLVAYASSGESSSEDEAEDVVENKVSLLNDEPKEIIKNSESGQNNFFTGGDSRSSLKTSVDTPLLSGDIEDDEYDILPTRSTDIKSSGLSLPPPKSENEPDSG